MILIDNDDVRDPAVNLALEEHCVRNLDPEPGYVLFYINEPSIIIGKNQNTIEEVNLDHVRARGIHVVRRISGGGAVYHDHGNLNFSFLKAYRPGTPIGFEEFTRPIVEALDSLGVRAELTGRNDLVVDGRKVSGNAQFTTVRSMFSHGTLLYDSHLEDVVDALKVKPSKIESKGVKSIRSRVANIREFMTEEMTTEAFRDRLLEHLFGSLEAVRRLRLDETQWAEVVRLADDKYRTWDWNYGRSPQFNVQRSRRFPFGEIDVRIDVRDGRIRTIRIFGDFLGHGDVADVERALVGTCYDRDAVRRALSGLDVERYFGGADAEAIAGLLHD